MQPTTDSNTIISEAETRAAKEKRINIPVVVLTLTTVIFAGLAVFFGITYFGGGANQPSGADSSSSENGSSAETVSTSSMAEEYAEVRSVMENVLSSIENIAYIQNGNGMAVKMDGMNTYITSRFNLFSEVRSDESSETDMTVLKDKLIEEGFSAIGVLPHGGSAGPQIDGYKNDSGIICGLYSDAKYVSDNYSYEYVYMGCARPEWTWLTENEKKLLNELELAYYEKTEKYPTILGNYTSGVKDSNYSPYQTMWINVGGAAGLFYRTSPDSEWQYFTATQGELECKDYDTDDLKKAYFGEKCFDATDGTEYTVQI